LQVPSAIEWRCLTNRAYAAGARGARLACRLKKGGNHPRKSIRLVQIHEVPAILELDIPSMGEFLRQRAQTGGNGRAVVFTGDHQCRHSQGLETCEAIAIQPCRHNSSIHLPAVDDVPSRVDAVEAPSESRIDEYRLEIEQSAVVAKSISGPQLDITF